MLIRGKDGRTHEITYFGESMVLKIKSDFMKSLFSKKTRKCFVCGGEFKDGDLTTITHTEKGCKLICEECFNFSLKE